MKKKTCKVTVNNESFVAHVGDLLLDGAIMNGVELPHDCRTGICGSCRVRLVEGKVFGGDNDGSDMIHACQSRLVSDIKIVTEPVPDPVMVAAQVTHLARLASDVIGVTMEVEKPFRYLPGQYCNVQFRGFPSRSGTSEPEKVPEPAAEADNIDDLRRQMKEMQERLERMSKEPKKEE